MKHRIVVLGAGYAGCHAAGRLARRLHPGDVEIVLVNAEPDFVERIRLHQLATGQDRPARPLAEVFAGTGVTIRTARVTAVDADRRTVELSDGEIAYDTLVYALGSTAVAAAGAHHVAARAAALRVRDRLRELPAGATVLVVGGGLTGIEAATEIAEAYPGLSVTIAARDRVGGWLSDKAQRHLTRAFARLAITVREHTEITGDGSADLTVWTTGFAAHPIAAASGLKVAATGQIEVDETMRSVSHPDVYAVGDAGFALGTAGQPLRMACGSSIPMAWAAADTIAARLTGGTAATRSIPYYGQCISLGRHDGIVQAVTTDDRAKPFALTGAAAARVKEFICTGAAWSIKHPTVLLPVRRRRVVAGRYESAQAPSSF